MPDAESDPRTPAVADPPPIDLGAPAPSPLHALTDPHATRPVPSSRRRLVLLSLVLAVALAGLAVVGASGYQIARQKDATLTAPPQLAGLVRDDTANARDTADYLRTAVAAEVDFTDSLGAVYDDPAASNRSVLLFGGTALIWTPESDLDSSFDLLKDDTGAVVGLHTVPPGPMGGVMKCGDATSSDGAMAVCGWADHGSLALAMFPNRTVADSAPLMGRIRDGIQKRH
jgi:hypothetical protein